MSGPPAPLGSTVIETEYACPTSNQAEQQLTALRELHAAMADVMELRRLSVTPEQRQKAEAAIAVWRRVDDFLNAPSPSPHALNRMSERED